MRFESSTLDPLEGHSDYSIAFRRPMAHGLCVGVMLPPRAKWEPAFPKYPSLQRDEHRHAESLPLPVRVPWIGGRLALKEALFGLGHEGALPLLPTKCGAPRLPEGYAGSISHKYLGDAALAVALVARQNGLSLGVDIEPLAPARPALSGQVLTQAEIHRLKDMHKAGQWPEILLRFCTKEAVYKALNPVLGIEPTFFDLTVLPQPDGRVLLDWILKPPLAGGTLDARWLVADGFVIASAGFRCSPTRAARSRN